MRSLRNSLGTCGAKNQGSPASHRSVPRNQEYSRYLETVEPISKNKAFFETGTESFFRPEIYRVKQRVKGLVKGLNSGDTFRWNNIVVPCGLKNTYPVGQSVLINEQKTEKCVDAQDVLKTILKYQYGAGAENLITKETEIIFSKKTGRIRRVMRGAKLLGTVRANDGMFILVLMALVNYKST